jgi:hypothetical protein
MPSIISTPGKHRLSGKMAEELPLVDGDVLDADRDFVAAHADDAVDHQERIAVRQSLEDRRDLRRLKRGIRLVHHPPRLYGWSIFRKKPAPHLMRGGHRFSERKCDKSRI